MDINGNGRTGGSGDEGYISFGPFRLRAGQARLFGALTYALSAIIIGFLGLHDALYGGAETWTFVIAGMLRGFIQNVLTGALMSLAIVNFWEAMMGQINPFEILGSGKGPKWMRRRIARNREEYARERVAEAVAIKEREHADAVVAAEARGRELGRREAERERENG